MVSNHFQIVAARTMPAFEIMYDGRRMLIAILTTEMVWGEIVEWWGVGICMGVSIKTKKHKISVAWWYSIHAAPSVPIECQAYLSLTTVSFTIFNVAALGCILIDSMQFRYTVNHLVHLLYEVLTIVTCEQFILWVNISQIPIVENQSYMMKI